MAARVAGQRPLLAEKQQPVVAASMPEDQQAAAAAGPLTKVFTHVIGVAFCIGENFMLQAMCSTHSPPSTCDMLT